MENTNNCPVSYNKDLLSDITCLLNFIKDIPNPNTFWEPTTSSNILNTALSDVEFTPTPAENSKGPFVISVKNRLYSQKIIVSNEKLSQFNLTTTDPENGLPIKFANLQKKHPHLTVENALTIIINKNNRRTAAAQIDAITDYLKQQTYSLSGNEDKKSEITTFFDFVKRIIQREFASNGSLTAEELLFSTHLNFHFMLEINTLLLALTTKKGLSQISSPNIPKALLTYMKLLDKVKKAFPEKSEGNLHKLITIAFRVKIDNESLLNNFTCFEQACQGIKGFHSIFGDSLLYHSVKKAYKEFNTFKRDYISLIHLIRALPTRTNNQQEITATLTLKEKLTHLTDEYFEKLITIRIYSHKSEETKKNLEKKEFEKFKSEIHAMIEKYQVDNPPTLEQLSILNKILKAIASLIPNFIISKNAKISFFRKHSFESKQFATFEHTVQSITPN